MKPEPPCWRGWASAGKSVSNVLLPNNMSGCPRPPKVSPRWESVLSRTPCLSTSLSPPPGQNKPLLSAWCSKLMYKRLGGLSCTTHLHFNQAPGIFLRQRLDLREDMDDKTLTSSSRRGGGWGLADLSELLIDATWGSLTCLLFEGVTGVSAGTVSLYSLAITLGHQVPNMGPRRSL